MHIELMEIVLIVVEWPDENQVMWINIMIEDPYICLADPFYCMLCNDI